MVVKIAIVQRQLLSWTRSRLGQTSEFQLHFRESRPAKREAGQNSRKENVLFLCECLVIEKYRGISRNVSLIRLGIVPGSDGVLQNNGSPSTTCFRSTHTHAQTLRFIYFAFKSLSEGIKCAVSGRHLTWVLSLFGFYAEDGQAFCVKAMKSFNGH